MADEQKRVPAVSATIICNPPDVPAGIELKFADERALVLLQQNLTPEILQYAMWHGIKQKLIDAAAISRNPATGRSATINDKFEAVQIVYDRLRAGQWNATRGEGGTGDGGLLFRALVALYPTKSPESLREYLNGKTPTEQAGLRKNPRIAAKIDELRAAGIDVDYDAQNAELDNIGGE